ncbi:MAG TPA: DNA recombination protein RmuC [Thermodesulfobacteriota bacterium]|jgi:DNA recombination protein RmuC|nr:DNA recombination protein RmuC [Thermodesulfobacteriota bacterium]
MQGIYVLLILIVALGAVLFSLMEQRWRRRLEEIKANSSSQPMWALMQQQLEQLRGQMGDGLNKNISLLTEQLRAINEQVNQQLQMVNQQLQNSSGQIGQRLDSTREVIRKVSEKLGELSKTSEQIHEVGKNIATLQEILRPPKLRGGLGEQFLGELLSQILPPEFFTLQYTFLSGERVDAVVRIGEKLVPIDSKFPLDNFKRVVECKADEERKTYQKIFYRDVKKHIDDIANKYILPQEGTYDFALLYIPAENVYYETITKDESFGEEKGVLNYALTKRVIPVSPNSFYAYLQVIILGLKGLQIEKDALKIQALLSGLKKDIGGFQEDFLLVGKHLINAVNKFEEARRRLDKFSFKLDQIESQPSLPFKEKGGEPIDS